MAHSSFDDPVCDRVLSLTLETHRGKRARERERWKEGVRETERKRGEKKILL